MAERNADNADLVVDELKRKARRRLVGAIVLALAAAIILPMLLEKDPRPLGDDVSVQIPPVDEGKFINRLTGKSGDTKPLPKADDKADPKAGPGKAEPRPGAIPDTAVVAAVPATKGAVPAAPAQTAAAPVDAPPPGKSLSEVEQRVLAPKPAPKAEPKAVSPPPAAAKPAASETKAAPKAAAPDAKSAPKAATTETKAEPKSSTTETKVEPKSAAEVKPESAAPVAETKPEPKPEPKAAPAEPKAAPVASSATAAAPPASPAKAEGFVVQLAAFADDKGANALANKLRKAGYAAYVEPVETSRGTLWRVRVGGYGSRPDADAARVKLKGEGYSGIVAPAK